LPFGLASGFKRQSFLSLFDDANLNTLHVSMQIFQLKFLNFIKYLLNSVICDKFFKINRQMVCQFENHLTHISFDKEKSKKSS
jgi:hypothetical protein